MLLWSPSFNIVSAVETIDSFNQQLLQNAFKAIGKKNDNQAAAFLHKFLESYPNNREALLALAQLSNRQRKHADADIFFSRILRNAPDDVQTMYEFGLNKWQLKQGYEAQTALFRALNMGGLAPEQTKQAKAVLAAIYKDWSVLRVMKERNDLEAQERFYSHQIADNPDGAAVSYAMRGFIHQRMGKPDEAERDFTSALTLGGMSDELTAGVQGSVNGIVKERERRRQAALWVEINAKVQDLEEKNDTRGLEQYLSGLIEQGEAQTFALSRRGNLRLKLGDLDAAEADFNAALETQPDKRQETNIRRGLKQIARLREAQAPGSQNAGGKAATLAAEANRLAKAPNGPNLLYEAGLKKLDEFEEYEAQHLLSLALDTRKLDPAKTASARETLAKLYDNWDIFTEMKEQQDLAGQERFMTYQIEKAPEKASVPYGLRGFIRWRMKNLAGAKLDFEQALAMDGMQEEMTTSVKNSLAIVEQQIANRGKRPAPSRAGTKGSYIGVWNYFKEAVRLMEEQSYTKAAEVLQKAGKLPRNSEEKALWHWHNGEVAWRDGNTASAANDFALALPGLKTPFYLSGALVRLADYHAQTGNAERAADYAAQAASVYPEPWRLAQISGIYMKLNMPESAVESLQSALRNEQDPLKQAQIHRSLAGVYSSMQDRPMQDASMHAYLELMSANKDKLSSAELAEIQYYQAELLFAEGKEAEAIAAYRNSLEGLTDTSRRSAVYLKTANYMAAEGNAKEAEENLDLYVAIAPADPGRLRQASRVMERTGNLDKAIFYASEAYEATPDPDPAQARSLAYLYRRNGNQEQFNAYHYAYMDFLYAQIETLGSEVPDEVVEELWRARAAQTASEKTWGFNSYSFGSFRENHDRYSGFVNELYTNWRLTDWLNPKLYVQLNGTYDSYSSGTWVSQLSGRRGEWEAKSGIKDTLHMVVGVKIKPIPDIPHIGLAAEQVFALSDGKDDEFRFRLNYFRGWGDKPRPFGWNWHYATIYNDITYTTRDNDFRLQGTARLGRTFTFDQHRDILVFPFMRASWDHWGQGVSKGKRWGLEAGPGIGIKKFLFEDRYHGPRASMELSLSYVYGLSHDKPDGIAFNFGFSF